MTMVIRARWNDKLRDEEKGNKLAVISPDHDIVHDVVGFESMAEALGPRKDRGGLLIHARLGKSWRRRSSQTTQESSERLRSHLCHTGKPVVS